MRRLNLDVIGVVILAMLLLIATLFQLDNPWIRSLLALPLALYGVGYSFGKALFPARPVDAAERLLLSIGSSLCILILTGLLLHILPGGLQPQGWAAMLFLISLVTAIVVLFRRLLEEGSPAKITGSRRAHSTDWPQGPDDAQSLLPSATTQPGTGQKSGEGIRGSSFGSRKAKPLPVLVFGLSLLLLVLSLGLAFRPAPQSPYQGYSMFWITPVKSGAVGQAELGVHSMEFGSQSYRVELYAGSRLVQRWDVIHLAPEQEWTVLLYQQDFPEGTELLEARLYRLDRPKTVYRQVWLRPSANLSSSPSGGH